MTQEVDLDAVVRQRIRGLRLARGWTLDALAARCFLSPSTLSRLETGHRRIALDQLVPIARALGTTLDQLVDRPGTMVAKMRLTPERAVGPEHQRVHPGHEWFTVLSGTAVVYLADRRILVHEGQAAEFSTMVPHSFGAHDGPVEILTIFDQEGERAHLSGTDPA